MPKGWTWDESLYSGSARHYLRGRPPYAPGLATALTEALDLDGRGLLLDVGCGPGVITLLLAPLFATAIGVDPDRDMLAEGARMAQLTGTGNVRWVQARAEELPPLPESPRVATFAQSFHWMDQPNVAAIMRAVLE